MSRRGPLVLLLPPLWLLLATAAQAAGDADGSRTSAAPLALEEVVTDDVSIEKDRADWRRVDLVTGGFATCSLHWDDATAELSLDVVDGSGATVATAPTNKELKRKVSLEVEAAAPHFIRVAAIKGASSYTLRCRWAAVSGAPIGKAPPEDADHPRCRIVGNQRDSKGRLVIFLESGAKVARGVRGQVIDETDSFVPGGEFTIDKVADATKSVGLIAANQIAMLKPKQNRCVLYVLGTVP